MIKQGVIIIISIIFIIHVNTECPKFCLNCTNQINCLQCQQGYFIFKNSSCPSCPQWCLNCQIKDDNKPICYKCSSLTQLNPQTGICFLCNPLCINCSLTPNNCTLCQNDRILQIINNTGYCIKIPSCPYQNCIQCSSDINNMIYCSKCLNGYFTFNFGCQLCRYPCQSCSFNIYYNWDYNIKIFWEEFILRIIENQIENEKITYLKNLVNFNNLTISGIKGWMEGYFGIKAFQNMIPSQLLDQFVMKQINYVVGIKNESYQQMETNIFLQLIALIKKNWTISQINQRILQIGSSLTVCSQCHSGFYLNTTTKTCMFCAQHCISCSNNSSCQVCAKGFFLVNQLCYPCKYPCSQCSNSQTNCTSCIAPASISQSGNCQICYLPCISCLRYNSSFCLTCTRPFSHNASSYGSCYRCKQDLCISCSSLNTSICLQCKNGYVLMNGICQFCSGNCASCSIGFPTICFQCRQGFVLVNNSKCLPCTSGCLYCSENNRSVCLQCQKDAYLNSVTGRCQQCNKDCLSCPNMISKKISEEGIVLFGNQYIKCRPGCSICHPLKPDLCIECLARYFLVSNQFSAVCKLCSEGCINCTNHLSCTSCLSNYILINGICHKCEDNCQLCSSLSPTQCLICKRGFILALNRSCITNCGKGCIECHSYTNQCFVCGQGYALEEKRNLCIKCLSSCSGTCDPKNITICIDCVEGFELLDNQCVRCPKGCLQCIGGSCSMCKQGYSLIKEDAIDGPFICQESCSFPCRSGSLLMCYSCFSGYILINNTCVPDVDCNPNCLYCPSGTFVNISQNICQLCPTNCASCQNQSACYQCFDGYALILQNNTCIQCPYQCRTCYDNLTCKICIEGYTKQILYMISGINDAIFSDKCIKCENNCKSCLMESDRCESCYDNYYLMNFRCINLFTVRYRIQINSNYSQFLNNSESHFFIQTLSLIVGVSTDDHYINSIMEGSTIINGTISAYNLKNAIQIQNYISSGQLSGYAVISSSSVIYYGNQPHHFPQIIPNISVDDNIAFFVGVLVGGIAILVILVIVIIRRRNKAQINVQIINDNRQIGQDKSEYLSNTQQKEKKHNYFDNNIQIEIVTKHNYSQNNIEGDSQQFSQN